MDELCYERRFPDVCRCVLAAVGALVLAMSLGGSQSTDTVFGSELPRCKGMPSGSPPVYIATADGRLFTGVGGCVGDETVGSY